MTQPKTIAERVAELLAEAPPITDEQREAAVRILGPALRAQAEQRAMDSKTRGREAA
jgi:hypothetical protein